MEQRKIVLAYRRGQINMGGKIMRVDQLSEIAKAHFPDNYDVAPIFVPRPRYKAQMRQFLEACEGAVVIFHKSAASNLDPETRAALRKVAAGICVDHLDIVVSPLEPDFFDVHIATSRVGEAELSANLDYLGNGLVCHLRHHADPRLTGVTAARLRSLKLGYFGAAGNIDDIDALPDKIIMPDYDPEDIEDFLASYGKANLHLCARTPYGVRAHGALATKPFTKGFGAGVVKANVLVNAQVHDAVHYLGDDYPYMITENSTQAIADGIAKAEDEFGSDTWKLGLDRMADMTARIAPEKVADDLKQIVDLF